ncbi:MAG: hypothetical protein M3R36_04370 [Bacteroidota bacterium]|nr:hypothetical protein [Bacteroidota bacterium]
MIRELINFANKIDKRILEENLKPREGLHILIELDENSNFKGFCKVIFNSKKESELSDEDNKILKYCSKVGQYTKDISSHKYLDQGTGGKKIHSCSPFCVAFKKSNLSVFNGRLQIYFDKAIEVCCKGLEDEKTLANNFKNYCETNLYNLLTKDDDLKEITNKLKAGDYITVYFQNASVEQYEKTYQNYLTQYLYLKNEYNFPKNRFDYGLSSYLNGLNTKKIFLEHKTASFNINGRISNRDAIALNKFSQLKANRVLPNPLPIFIEEDELNSKVISLYCEDKNIIYSEIIQKIFETRSKDLHNYYLINLQGGEVKDFDFVSTFRYKMNEIKVEQIFPISYQMDYEIKNIFDFERKIISRIFNNCLIRITDKGIHTRYFDDIDYNPKYITLSIYNLILKYRTSIYDYVYKSKSQSINGIMFKDILMTGILDDIKNDEIQKGYHTKENSIKEKLNIYFSINHHFDEYNNNFNNNIKGAYMPSRIKALQGRIIKIVQDENEHFNDDEEFAYGAGQLIYYLLYQSETSKKTHALLEPFLQKTQCNLLLNSVSRTIDLYKHNISFGGRKFNKLASEVLGYVTNENLKQLTSFLLAGYFSNNIILDINIKI